MSQVLEKQLRRIFLEAFKAGEQNIIDDDIIQAYEMSNFTARLQRHRYEFEEHQINFSRIIYGQYLEKLIKDTTNQIFQERPSLP